MQERQERQERTLWDKIADFFGFLSYSFTRWADRNPAQVTGTSFFSLGLGFFIGILSGGSLLGVVGAVTATLATFSGLSYLGVKNNNNEEIAEQLGGQVADPQATTTELRTQQTETNAENQQLHAAIAQNEITIRNLQQTNSNASEQRAGAAILTEIPGDAAAPPTENPAVQQAPDLFFSQRSAIRQRRVNSPETEASANTNNTNP